MYMAYSVRIREGKSKCKPCNFMAAGSCQMVLLEFSFVG